MIKITGYYEYNGSKSTFKRMRNHVPDKKLEECRCRMEKETGHQILFVKQFRTK